MNMNAHLTTIDLTLYPEWVDLMVIGVSVTSDTIIRGFGLRLHQIDQKWPDALRIEATLETMATVSNGETAWLIVNRNTGVPIRAYHAVPGVALAEIDLMKVEDLYGFTITDLATIAKVLQK